MVKIVVLAMFAVVIAMSCAGSVFAADIKELTAAAEAGDVGAQYAIATMYYDGVGVEEDYVKAAEWFLKAAEQGHAEAQYYLALMYDEGDGVEHDSAKAAEWYLKAAEQGFAEAQYNLGVSYTMGDGVAQDHAKAVEWYSKAAEHGHAEAQYNLGLSYAMGYGVEKDVAAAYMWWSVASMTDPNYEDAKDNLSIARKDLTDAQIKEAESKAKAKFEEIERNKK